MIYNSSKLLAYEAQSISKEGRTTSVPSDGFRVVYNGIIRVSVRFIIHNRHALEAKFELSGHSEEGDSSCMRQTAAAARGLCPFFSFVSKSTG